MQLLEGEDPRADLGIDRMTLSRMSGTNLLDSEIGY